MNKRERELQALQLAKHIEAGPCLTSKLVDLGITTLEQLQATPNSKLAGRGVGATKIKLLRDKVRELHEIDHPTLFTPSDPERELAIEFGHRMIKMMRGYLEDGGCMGELVAYLDDLKHRLAALKQPSPSTGKEISHDDVRASAATA